MAKYKVVKPINLGSGYVKDKSGKMIAMNEFAPKVGDIIELGESQKRFIFNTQMEGHTFYIVKDGETLGQNFIPADSVEKVADATTNKTTFVPNRNFLFLAVLVVGGYLVYKKYK